MYILKTENKDTFKFIKEYLDSQKWKYMIIDKNTIQMKNQNQYDKMTTLLDDNGLKYKTTLKDK